ncbi:sorbitol dehydrogenase [Peptococcaceae bacterium CEB3]|nr:sorbitol dehydrogenase [Peptococcaceae bacterium CEB3]
MKAAVLRKMQDLVIEEVPEPSSTPPGHVKVAVKAVGICGSDVHYYKEGAIGSFVVREPMILGHEVGGIIEEIGEGVDLPVGAVVALEPGIPCGKCQHCRTGEYNLCPEVRFFATPPVDGVMTGYVVHPAEYTFLADGLTPEEASLAEPMSVGVYACREASIHLGQRVAVLGAGPIGILTAMAAYAEGAIVSLFDVRKKRVEFACSLGFSAWPFRQGPDLKYDRVIDCSGNRDAIQWGQSVVRPGGKLILVGMGAKGSMLIDGLDLASRGISVQGIFRYSNTFPAAIELIRRHRGKLAAFTEKRIPLDELPTYLASNEYLGYIKTIVTVD